MLLAHFLPLNILAFAVGLFLCTHSLNDFNKNNCVDTTGLCVSLLWAQKANCCLGPHRADACGSVFLTVVLAREG